MGHRLHGNTSLSSTRPGWTHPGLSLDASAAVGGTSDVWNVTAGSASGGSFTLNVDSLVTGPILWNASALDVETALLAAGVTATVTGTGSIVDPWVITFAAAPVAVTPDFALLTMGVSDASTVHYAADTYVVDLGTAYGGTFTLSADGATTAPIAWNASPLDIETAFSSFGVTVFVGGASPTWSVLFAIPPTTVSIDGSGLAQPPSLGATATAYGSVDQVVVTNFGSGYQMPTVDFDMPTDPNGVQAKGHVLCVEANCQAIAPATTVTITGVQVDQVGTGYTLAPGVTIRDGTINDPVPGGGTGAEAHSTLVHHIHRSGYLRFRIYFCSHRWSLMTRLDLALAPPLLLISALSLPST